MNSFKSALLLISALTLGSMSFAHAADAGANTNLGATPLATSVIDEFGGEAGLTLIVSDFFDNLVADTRTEAHFKPLSPVGVRMLKLHLKNQFCEVLGGGCKYTGRDMKSTHAGMDINRGSYNALVESLQLAMDKNNVPFASQNKLLSKLAPMYRNIEKPSSW